MSTLVMSSVHGGSKPVPAHAVDVCAEVRNIAVSRRNAPYLVDAMNGRTVTYGEHAAAAQDLAVALRAAGISRGSRVLVALPNSLEFATMYFAALYLGAIVVPVNLQLHEREVNFLVRHSRALIGVRCESTRTVLTDALLDELQLPVLELAGNVVTWRSGDVLGNCARTSDRKWRPFDDVRQDDVFSITFTSGTTSLPKAVPHRVNALFGAARAFNSVVGLGPETRMLHVLNMAYVAGFLNTLLCPYMAGGTVVLTSQFNAGSVFRFWDTVRDHHVNTLWVSPTILESLLRLDRDPAGPQVCHDNIHTICVGTAPLPSRTRQAFEAKYGVQLLESYGLSELLFVASQSGEAIQQEGSVGRLLDGVRLRVMDDSGNLLASGLTGELSVQTPFLMVGYLNYESGKPEELSSDCWFDTGDVGYVSSDGNLFITGRKKDIIIRGGVNISPRVIEEVLLTHPKVSNVAVVGVPHTFYGEEVVAVIVTTEGVLLDDEVRESLLSHARSRLAASAIPAKWMAVDALPMNAIGKVQKHKLRETLAVQ